MLSMPAPVSRNQQRQARQNTLGPLSGQAVGCEQRGQSGIGLCWVMRVYATIRFLR